MKKNFTKAPQPPPVLDASGMSRGTASWYPPGADVVQDQRQTFASEFEEHFHVPSRIAEMNHELISTVNDFHFAMMNDCPRNEFYYNALKAVVKPTSVIVEIGTGSGLLAMIAAKLGAKHVTAIEANKSLAMVARRNMDANGLGDKITIINKMSTDVTAKELKYGKADILVSEILGTLLLSESALEFNNDARKRLLKKGAIVIPHGGVQHVTLVESERLDVITTARNWKGMDFTAFNSLRDTSSLIFTKQVGCRFHNLGYNNMSARVPIIECNFATGQCNAAPPLERRMRAQIKRTGTVHAALYSWEVYSDPKKTQKMTTHVEDTVDNFPRDMQWGQGVQVVDDYVASERVASEAERRVSVPLTVKKGEWVDLVVRYASDGVLIQCLVERLDKAGAPISWKSEDFSDEDRSDNGGYSGEGSDGDLGDESGDEALRDLD